MQNQTNPEIKEATIQDFLPYLSNGKHVEVLINEDWVLADVIGINLYTEEVYLQTESFALWQRLYFRLNSNFPKNYKVRIPVTLEDETRYHTNGQISFKREVFGDFWVEYTYDETGQFISRSSKN